MRFTPLIAVLLLAAVTSASAHLYVVASPSHGQTFAYGSERHRQWAVRGSDHHLALYTEFTNDPYVDRTFPRQYDDFTFDFPEIRLGADGNMFYYQPPKGRPIAVAERHAGLDEVRLLDNAQLLINKKHGRLSLSLLISDRPPTNIYSL